MMVQLDEKPILFWQIEWLKVHGITRFILAVSYKYEGIEQYFGNGEKLGVSITYSIEDQPLGRGN